MKIFLSISTVEEILKIALCGFIVDRCRHCGYLLYLRFTAMSIKNVNQSGCYREQNNLLLM